MSSIKKNYIYNLIYQLLLILIPLLTTPYLSRILGAEGLGVYSYVYSIANYFVVVAMLGIANYGNRSIAYVKDDKEKLNKTFSEIYTLQLLLFIFAFIIYIIFTFIFVKEYKLLYLIQIFYLLSGLIDISWCFFGLEKFKLTVTRNVFVKVITVICIFVFVKNSQDIWIYSLIMSIGTFISQAFLWFYLKRYITIIKVNLKNVLSHFKSVVVLFVPVIAYSFYKIMDKIMLGNLYDFEQVGYYINSEKLINIPLSVITALGVVMLPRISNLRASGGEKEWKLLLINSIKFIIIISIAMTFGLVAISENFVPLFFGEGFEPCIKIIYIMASSIIFISVANVLRTQYLIPFGLDKIYVISTLAGGLINVGLNIIFIPLYGAIGASIGTLVAEFTVFLIQCILIVKKINVFKYLAKFSSFLIIGLLMMCVVILVGDVVGLGFYALVLQILFGVLIYSSLSIVVLIFLKDDLVIFIKSGIKKFVSSLHYSIKDSNFQFSNKLSWCYLLLSFFILFTHSSADFLIPHSPYVEIQNFIISVVNIAVSTFFFLSAFMFYKSINKRRYISTIVSKLRTLIYPFIIWNLVMFILKAIKYRINGTLDSQFDLSIIGIVEGLLKSTYNPVLWFSLNLFIYFLLFPIIKLVLHNKKIGLCYITLVFAVNIVFANNIQYSGLLYWLPIYSSGAFLGMHYPEKIINSSLNEVNNKKKIFLLVSLISMFSILCLFSKTSSEIEFIYRFFTPFIFWKLLDFIKFPHLPLEFQNSFFVYCTQILFISVINGILKELAVNNVLTFTLWFLSSFLIFVLQHIIAFILRKSPRLWNILFGHK